MTSLEDYKDNCEEKPSILNRQLLTFVTRFEGMERNAVNNKADLASGIIWIKQKSLGLRFHSFFFFALTGAGA